MNRDPIFTLDSLPRNYDEVYEVLEKVFGMVDVLMKNLDIARLDYILGLLTNLVDLIEMGQHGFPDSLLRSDDYAALLSQVHEKRNAIFVHPYAHAIAQDASGPYQQDFRTKFNAQAELAGMHLREDQYQLLVAARQHREELAGQGKKLVQELDATYANLLLSPREIASWPTFPDSLQKWIQADGSLLVTAENYGTVIRFAPTQQVRMLLYLSRFGGRQLILPKAAEYLRAVQEEARLLGRNLSWTGWLALSQGQVGIRYIRFINGAREVLYSIAKREMAVWKKATGTAQIYNFEWEFFSQQVAQMISPSKTLISLDEVLNALKEVVKKWFGLELDWHEWSGGFANGLMILKLTREGEVIGRTILDLFAREAKVENGFQYTLSNTGFPVLSAIAMNLDMPAGGHSVMLTIAEVRTLLHEFIGHALQYTLVDPMMPYRWASSQFGTMHVEVLTKLAESLLYHPDFPLEVGSREASKVGQAILLHHQLSLAKWFAEVFNWKGDFEDHLLRDYWYRDCFADVFDEPSVATPFTIPSFIHWWLRHYGPLYGAYSYSDIIAAWLTDIAYRQDGMGLISEMYARGAVGVYTQMLEEVAGEEIDLEALARQLADMPTYDQWLEE